MVNVLPGTQSVPDVGDSTTGGAAASVRSPFNTLVMAWYLGIARDALTRARREYRYTSARGSCIIVQRPDSGRMPQSCPAPYWTLEQREDRPIPSEHGCLTVADRARPLAPNAIHLPDHTATLLMESAGAMLSSTCWPGATTKSLLMYTVLLPIGSTMSWNVPSGEYFVGIRNVAVFNPVPLPRRMRVAPRTAYTTASSQLPFRTTTTVSCEELFAVW